MTTTTTTTAREGPKTKVNAIYYAQPQTCMRCTFYVVLGRVCLYIISCLNRTDNSENTQSADANKTIVNFHTNKQMYIKHDKQAVWQDWQMMMMNHPENPIKCGLLQEAATTFRANVCAPHSLSILSIVPSLCSAICDGVYVFV